MRRRERKPKPANPWPLRALFVIVAMVALIVDHYYKGLGAPVVVTLGVFSVSLALSREYWRKPQYWIATAVLLAVVIPVNLRLGPWMEKGRFFALFVVAVVELIVVALAISLAAGRDPELKRGNTGK